MNTKHTILDDTLLRSVATTNKFVKINKAIYIELSPEILAKIELNASSKYQVYDSIKCSILNKKYGVIDTNIIEFSAAFSPKLVAGKTVYNYIWHSIKDFSWYLSEPTISEFKNLQELINEYLDVFRD